MMNKIVLPFIRKCLASPGLSFLTMMDLQLFVQSWSATDLESETQDVLPR